MPTHVFRRIRLCLPILSLAVLSACGGGGGSTDNTTVTTTTTTTIASGSVILSGVAATGAPILGATVKVVDATGTPVALLDASGAKIDSGTTSSADGAYRFVLSTTAPKAPLFIQLSGVDATGKQVVLHSLVQASTQPLIAHITPATNAVVAQILGSDPKAVFIGAIDNASSIALLGNAGIVSNAANQVKTIIKPNLTDGKITDAAKLDLFQDIAFSANKTGLDFALEGLIIQISKDSSGKDQLQFSNKFNPLGSTEVIVDLATAKAELVKTTGGSVAKAITSTIKATTSPTAILTNLGVLDDLSTALNKLIAQGATAATFKAAPMLATYTTHNGRTQTDLANKLADYALHNYQLSKFQVTGCADYPVTAKACVKVLVSALVTDTSGKRVEVFSDAATYSKTTTPNWVLVGNAASADLSVFPVAYNTYGLNGAQATATATNSGYGVQVLVSPAASDTTGRVVQIPSGYSIPFAYCGRTQFCVQATSSSAPTATGELKDTLPQQLASGLLGNLDAAAGAKYLVALTGSNAYSPAYLPADVPTDLSTAPFPMLDDIATGKPLTAADIQSTTGLTLSWANWAAANPNLRIILARASVSSATAYAYADATLPLAAVTTVKVPAIIVPGTLKPTTYQVWLGAQDNLGRRYFSKFTSAP